MGHHNGVACSPQGAMGSASYAWENTMRILHGACIRVEGAGCFRGALVLAGSPDDRSRLPGTTVRGQPSAHARDSCLHASATAVCPRRQRPSGDSRPRTPTAAVHTRSRGRTGRPLAPAMAVRGQSSVRACDSRPHSPRAPRRLSARTGDGRPCVPVTAVHARQRQLSARARSRVYVSIQGRAHARKF